MSKKAAKKSAPKPETVLVLRTCAKDLTSHGGFQWPSSGSVAAPDWSPVAECGHGLHGALWGEGNGELLSWDPDAKWLVVEVEKSPIVDLGGKVKFPRGKVVHCGDRLSATAYLAERAPGHAIIGGLQTVGDQSSAASGYKGTATAGERGTATAGEGGTATAGERGTATAGYKGTATAGYKGTATAGNWGTATAGEGGTATAGNWGTATAGEGGTATAGEGGTATAGYKGTATAGEGGTLQLRWWDGKRYRFATFYVGEDGIEAEQPYRLDEHGKPVKVAK